MKRVTVDATGRVAVQEADPPELRPNGILTRSIYSLINTGTEVYVVGNRPQGDPDEVEILGCSNCGRVLEVGPECAGSVKSGDLVACGGLQMATHGEVCSVPRHMFAVVPDDGFVTTHQPSMADRSARQLAEYMVERLLPHL